MDSTTELPVGTDRPPLRSLLLAGASGLVGREVLRLLALDRRFDRMVILSRRPLLLGSDPRLDLRVLDFQSMDGEKAGFPVNAVICTLGTTRRKAGSRKAFREVDFEYPLRLAELAKAAGADRFVLVSSMGANPSSPLPYLRTKGEVEGAVAATGVYGLTILRPSLLLGERPEFRPEEEVAKRLSRLLPTRYRGISAGAVARVLVGRAACSGVPGPPEILDSAGIRREAAGYRRP